MKILAGVLGYIAVGLATGGWVWYRHCVLGEKGSKVPELEQSIFDGHEIGNAVCLAAMFWPVAWTICIPYALVMTYASRLADRTRARQAIARKDAEEVERVLRDL